MHRDVIIIGAGASGLMCALFAAGRGRSVALLDHAARIGAKIGVSGGGRCNFTNLSVSDADYVSDNPRFVRSALAGFRPADMIAFLGRHGLAAEEKSPGQLFCAQGAAAVVRAFETELAALGVETLLDREVLSATGPGPFRVQTSRETITASSLVVAAGGLAWPQVGATNLGFRLAKEFGHRVTPLTPALVPLLAGPEELEFCRSLSGISCLVEARLGKWAVRDSLLFTHKGISGPAVLQATLRWREGQTLRLNFLPDVGPEDIATELAAPSSPRQTLAGWLDRRLPGRLAAALAARLDPSSRALAMRSKKDLRSMADGLHAFPFTPASSEGFGKAEVTAGGVDTREVSSKTMESSKVEGLYFTGEVLDVTGRLGGYNLHWAWASGAAAGRVA